MARVYSGNFTVSQEYAYLATIDLSYFSSGINITVKDNPAGRPHVTIEQLQ